MGMVRRCIHQMVRPACLKTQAPNAGLFTLHRHWPGCPLNTMAGPLSRGGATRLRKLELFLVGVSANSERGLKIWVIRHAIPIGVCLFACGETRGHQRLRTWWLFGLCVYKQAGVSEGCGLRFGLLFGVFVCLFTAFLTFCLVEM